MQRLFAVLTAACLFAACFVASATTSAIAAPKQLYGKSVSVRWMEDLDEKGPAGDLHHFAVSAAVGIYVSSKGRTFARMARTGGMTRFGASPGYQGVARSRDPEGGVINAGGSHYETAFQFQGQTLFGHTLLESGVRRMVVTFDADFRTCNVEITYGKEQGVPGVVLHGMSGRLWLVQSSKVSSQSCTVVDGNMFGDAD